MPSSNQDLSYFKAGLESLERYLLSDELFWFLGGDWPLLTLGGMLLAGKRLAVGSAQCDWPMLKSRLIEIRSKWHSVWERKAGREIHARLNLWKNYLQELQDKSDPTLFPQQVRWRVMLQLLGSEISTSPQELKNVDTLDLILKSIWLPGTFIWEPRLSIAFPEQEYWYLYGSLKFDKEDRS